VEERRYIPFRWRVVDAPGTEGLQVIMTDFVDNERVERGYQELEKLRRLAWSLPLADAAALAERVRVELMIDKKLRRSTKRFYHAYSDYLDEIVEERAEQEAQPRETFQHQIFAYIRGMLEPDRD
jgi:hypothetical protein